MTLIDANEFLDEFDELMYTLYEEGVRRYPLNSETFDKLRNAIITVSPNSFKSPINIQDHEMYYSGIIFYIEDFV